MVSHVIVIMVHGVWSIRIPSIRQHSSWFLYKLIGKESWFLDGSLIVTHSIQGSDFFV
jgi:hypothetical protein